ncbi:hypothetical protein GCM10023329_30310 [Streptomyces sanyensis]|uniref:Transposase n=1 Tax=Streptomyces sanyensis TaxID=568869 RepID=A0ABP9ACQ0_9ACTN
MGKRRYSSRHGVAGVLRTQKRLVWAHLEKSLGNLAPRTIDDLTPLVKNRLPGIQRRPEILDGFIAETWSGPEPP